MAAPPVVERPDRSEQESDTCGRWKSSSRSWRMFLCFIFVCFIVEHPKAIYCGSFIWQDIKTKSGILLLILRFFSTLLFLSRSLEFASWSKILLCLIRVKCKRHLWTLWKSEQSNDDECLTLWRSFVALPLALIPLSSVLYCKNTCHKCIVRTGFSWRLIIKRQQISKRGSFFFSAGIACLCWQMKSSWNNPLDYQMLVWNLLSLLLL